jgi:hypothetical protein
MLRAHSQRENTPRSNVAQCTYWALSREIERDTTHGLSESDLLLQVCRVWPE